MVLPKHRDLNQEDTDILFKFVTYLGTRTSWRCSFREPNRLGTMSFWDKQGTHMEGTYVGTVLDLLKLPVEDLVAKRFYPKSWENQLYLYRISEEG